MKKDTAEALTSNGGLQDLTTINVLEAAYKAWNGGVFLRESRLRNKKFTYGDQLEELITTPDGRKISERRYNEENGRESLKNNLIRQMVKSIIGRFRTLLKEDGNIEMLEIREAHSLDEMDSRMLEEFLISGCSIQKVDLKRQFNAIGLHVQNVNLNQFFINAIKDFMGRDCELVGEIHDMTISELIMRLSFGDRVKAESLRKIYSTEATSRTVDLRTMLGLDGESGTDFWHSSTGRCRVIEVWTLESREMLKCHDYLTGEYYVLPYESKAGVDSTNKEREKGGLPLIGARWEIEEVWHCRWISPMGDLLAEYDSPFPHKEHPYVVKMYPLTDGEVHSFVEDVIDQQKYVNRLISMIDHIMSVSAKGVLLYPVDALPEGYSWDDIKRAWASCNGVLPIDTNKNAMPQQISTNATGIGAHELLTLELKLFEEISGVTGVLKGKTNNSITGSKLYDSQVENASIALADIFETFNSFRHTRNKKIKSLAIC